MISIRPAAPTDEDIVYNLATQLSPAFIVDRQAFSASYKLMQSDPSICLHVAEIDENVIGYTLGWSRPAFYANGLVAWVQEIVVEPSQRRSGLGTQMMSHFEEWALPHDCRLVSLASRGAGDFYQAIGYTSGATYYKKALHASQEPGQ